jgi:hypothetical protein
MTSVLFVNWSGHSSSRFAQGFEGPSAVNVHWNAKGKCARRGVHCCRGRSGWGCQQRKENGVHRGTECVIGEGAE